MSFDIIKLVALGQGDDTSMSGLHEKLVRSTCAKDEQAGTEERDQPVLFPEHCANDDLEAHHAQGEALGASLLYPSITLYHLLHNFTGKMRKAYADKFRMLGRQVSMATKRLQAGSEVRSALDYMIQREIAAAKKGGRKPVFDSPYMYDELYGYIGAGHDTSSTTLQWGVKHIATNQEEQRRLREHLRAAYPTALAEGRQPTVAEMTRSQVPYLEAVIEEILRLSGPVRAVMRETIVDTTVLGHAIPKGTQIFLLTRGPTLTRSSYAVDESIRSETSRAHPGTRNSWDDADPEKFVPERWLRTEDGQQVFDAQAGPFLSFSAGVRGCFGKRLAYLQLRILVTLLIWNFELCELPEALNTWDVVETLTAKPKTCYVRLAEIK
jgi:cytochrome P450